MKKEIRSKINLESFLIIYFITFIISFVFSAMLFDNIKDLQNDFDVILVFKSFFLIISLIVIWLFFINIHTKILITANDITIKKFFKIKRYNFEELSFYFERIEAARFKKYNGLFVVKDNEVIERISSFDYSNYEEIKENFNLNEYKNVRIYIIDVIRIMLGQKIKISSKESKMVKK